MAIWLKRIGLGTAIIGLLGAILWFAGPRVSTRFVVEPVYFQKVEPSVLREFVATRELRLDGLRQQNEAEVVLRPDAEDRQTALSLVYIHGFSASRGEVSPLMEELGESLDAHLYFPRLAGHGFIEDQMGAEASLQRWMGDTMEALAIARLLGERVVVVGYSNGANLAILAALEAPEALRPDALVLLAPNFAPADPSAHLLAKPWARWWVPRFAGKERIREALNPLHSQFWSLEYATEALFAMKAAVLAVRERDPGPLSMPVLIGFAETDQVVSVDAIRSRFNAIDAPLKKLEVLPSVEDSRGHLIAGDAFSPATTPVVRDWIERFIEDAFDDLKDE